jgi:D-alanyl-D-alanine carboxypeptidase
MGPTSRRSALSAGKPRPAPRWRGDTVPGTYLETVIGRAWARARPLSEIGASADRGGVRGVDRRDAMTSWRRRPKGIRRAGLGFVVAGALAAGAFVGTAHGAQTGDATSGPTCGPNQIPRGDGCVSRAQAARQINAIVARTMRQKKLKSAIYSVRVGNRDVVTRARGTSMTGVPARPNMQFRIGSVAIAYLGTLALILQDEGALDLDEPIARHLPNARNADTITPRMLLLGTSGNRDFVGYGPFNRDFYADPFRQFTEKELIDYVYAQKPSCEPGACWGYSHGNFIILGQVMSRATGTPLRTLIQRKILRPAGLRNTASFSTARIPSPVLHAFTRERGTYEESTFWNPSWTLARGAVMTSNIRDVARSARVIGAGRLLSPGAYRDLLAPTTARFPMWNDRIFYGLGVVSANDWVLQNPSFAGYFAAMAYQPSQRISIAVASTKLAGAKIDPNYSNELVGTISRYLSPGKGLPASR